MNNDGYRLAFPIANALRRGRTLKVSTVIGIAQILAFAGVKSPVWDDDFARKTTGYQDASEARVVTGVNAGLNLKLFRTDPSNPEVLMERAGKTAPGQLEFSFVSDYV